MKATVQHRQSVFDLALHYFGAIEAAFLVAEKLGCSVTNDLTAGASFEFSASEVQDKRVADYYAKNDIIPTTALEYNSGIGSMEIEVDFRVF